MTPKQESSLSKQIYQNMQLKDTDELLAIWVQNDRREWTDETFTIVHDILIERLGSVPDQKKASYRKKQLNNLEQKSNKFWNYKIMLFPSIVALIGALLFPILQPGPDANWFTVLFSLTFAFSLFVPGIYLARQAWFHEEELKQDIKNRIPESKEKLGVLFDISHFFLPDRFIPGYQLIYIKIVAIVFILFGIGMIGLLIITLSQ